MDAAIVPDTTYWSSPAKLFEYQASGIPVLAPTAWSLSYTWPVQEIGPEFIPDEAPDEATHLVVYRDRLDEVHFLEINAVTQRLIQILKENPDWTGLEALKQIAQEMEHPQPEVVIAGGTALLQELKERNVVLGTRA